MFLYIYSGSSNSAKVYPKKITPYLKSHYLRLLNINVWSKFFKNPHYFEEFIIKPHYLRLLNINVWSKFFKNSHYFEEFIIKPPYLRIFFLKKDKIVQPLFLIFSGFYKQKYMHLLSSKL